MALTITGIILLLLSLYGFFFNYKFLYNITIFFIPFSATAIFNIGSGDNGSAVTPFMVLGGVWLFSNLSRNKNIFNIKIDKYLFYSLTSLLLFILIAFISLLMPAIINGSEKGNITGELNSTGLISFSIRNITQFVYLFFGFLMAVAICFHNRDLQNYKHTIRVYCYSIIFVVLWGYLELFCFYKNIPYPSSIFNNSISKSAGGFQGILDSEDGIKRISSVAVEPSILVQSIEILLPFLLFGIIEKKYIFSKYFDIIFTINLYFFIFRTTSSVGIVCLILISILVLLLFLRKLSFRALVKSLTILAFIIPISLIFIYFEFPQIVESTLFNKTESYSALERSGAIIEAWGTFLRHPILGAGWGSVTSYDLFIKILSNLGIIGFLSLVIFLYLVLKNQIKTQDAIYKSSKYRYSIIVSFIVLIFSNTISGFSFVFGFFWLATGLMLVYSFHSIDKV